MFRSAVRALRFKPEDGLHVVARGRLASTNRRASTSSSASTWSRRARRAAARVRAAEEALAAEGLFDAARKRPLPSLPRKIGIVTSLDGAALRDIVKVLRRRHPNAHLVIRPARVQGEGAAGDVARRSGDRRRAGRGRRDLRPRRRRIEKTSRRSTRKWSRAPSRRRRCRSCRRSDTRPTSPSPTSSPTCARRRRRPPPKWSSPRKTSSARASTGSHRLDAAVRQGIERRRASVHTLISRRGLAGWHAHVAMRGRHASPS
jgi:hypothetical protein